MAHIKSNIKRLRQNQKRRSRNMSASSRMKTFIKYVMTAIEAKDQEKLKAVLPVALSEIDRAAKKGILHKNSAARRKSMLQHRAAAISQ
jgi:small subunit ribosomal protein S20